MLRSPRVWERALNYPLFKGSHEQVISKNKVINGLLMTFFCGSHHFFRRQSSNNKLFSKKMVKWPNNKLFCPELRARLGCLGYLLSQSPFPSSYATGWPLRCLFHLLHLCLLSPLSGEGEGHNVYFAFFACRSCTGSVLPDCTKCMAKYRWSRFKHIPGHARCRLLATQKPDSSDLLCRRRSIKKRKKTGSNKIRMQ